MKKWIFLFIVIICGLLQATTANSIRLFMVKPDLLFACAVLAAVFFNGKWSFILSLSAGLIKDILGTEAFGFSAVLFVLWSYAITNFSRKVSIEDNLVLPVVMFITVICNDIITRFAFLYLGRYVSLGIFLKITLIESLYTSFFLFVLLKLLDYFRFFPVYKSDRAKTWIDETKNF